jgi:hypothetical protein
MDRNEIVKQARNYVDSLGNLGREILEEKFNITIDDINEQKGFDKLVLKNLEKNTMKTIIIEAKKRTKEVLQKTNKNATIKIKEKNWKIEELLDDFDFVLFCDVINIYDEAKKAYRNSLIRVTKNLMRREEVYIMLKRYGIDTQVINDKKVSINELEKNYYIVHNTALEC